MNFLNVVTLQRTLDELLIYKLRELQETELSTEAEESNIPVNDEDGNLINNITIFGKDVSTIYSVIINVVPNLFKSKNKKSLQVYKMEIYFISS